MLRRGGQGEEQEEGRGLHPGSEEAALEKANKEKEDKKLPPNVALMKYILRFLQLLCENHNTDLQVMKQLFSWTAWPFDWLFIC